MREAVDTILSRVGGYGGGGGHYSKYTQQVSFREPGRTDGRTPVYYKLTFEPSAQVS